MYAELDTIDSKGNKERTKHKLQEDKFKKKSPLLERERKLETKSIQEIQELFWEIHFLRKGGTGTIEPFDPQRIEAHIRLSGRSFCKWQYNLLMEMDLIYRATLLEKK